MYKVSRGAFTLTETMEADQCIEYKVVGIYSGLDEAYDVYENTMYEDIDTIGLDMETASMIEIPGIGEATSLLPAVEFPMFIMVYTILREAKE